MRFKTPALVATFAAAVIGIAGLGAAGGLEAVLGPSLAAIVATIFVLVR